MRKTAALTVHKRCYGITLENEFSDFVDISYLNKYIVENMKNVFFRVPTFLGLKFAKGHRENCLCSLRDGAT